MAKRKSKLFKLLLILCGLLIIVIIILIQLLYPRFKHSYKEIDAIYANNYVDGDYVKVKVSDEDKEKIYSIIKHSWIGVDFMVGDECGSDGPNILIIYTDGSMDSWGCAESNHTSYRKYQYINGWGSTAVWFKSKKLLSIIESYTQ